ncbi:hypothetical protein EBBID32_46080 [Sphingobium indicum BiD32]|uniref:Uncharacterized protein n=1 Tax=Sphingobium indicum BiD32 TaxID=1301087 RepID=N1MU10_9SPHN|nr:hypothetical protein EBBID32_46080 [Sphingobium indicum BiD32]
MKIDVSILNKMIKKVNSDEASPAKDYDIFFSNVISRH